MENTGIIDFKDFVKKITLNFYNSLIFLIFPEKFPLIAGGENRLVNLTFRFT